MALRRRGGHTRFRNRLEAGRILGAQLAHLAGDPTLLVLGLARGGVPVAWEVAAALNSPLDVCVVRKLGVPHWPELAMGALGTGGALVRNDDLVRQQNVTEDQFLAVMERESDELRRRENVYRAGRALPNLAGRAVILVDDGLATGASMTVAIRAVRGMGAARVTAAVPVGSTAACRQIRAMADELICVSAPRDFQAVGQVYDDFGQTTDDEVRALLGRPPRRR